MIHNRIWSVREFICFTILFFVSTLVTRYLFRSQRIQLSQAIAGLLAIVFLGIVFASTVFTRLPAPEQKYELQLFWSWKFVIDNYSMEMLKENLLNCILLLPLGLLLPIIYHRGIELYRGFLHGFCVSAAIETSQLIFRRGLFEWDDMIHNALGCMIGCLLMNWLMGNINRFIPSQHNHGKE